MSIICRHNIDNCSTCEYSEEAREEIERLQEERDKGRKKLEVIREQVAYGFTGETIANMTVPLTGEEMNRWWQKTISTILERK